MNIVNFPEKNSEACLPDKEHKQKSPKNNCRLEAYQLIPCRLGLLYIYVFDYSKPKTNENRLEKEYTTQFIKIIKAIMNQNYFQLNNKLYEKKEGIPMSSRISGIMSEIFLQNMENEHFHNIIRKQDRNNGGK